MTLLESIAGPRDVKQLDADQLPVLASEIRDLLVETVSRTSGHLGPNLGVVELTIALHRVFDSPVDKIVFDTGHQSYVHKLLTGRVGEFGSLRQRGGLSGYPSRAESEHDLVENSHASTSLSYADGLAKAYRLRGETDRTVVAVIGDGALTGGMAWEALNNISVAKDSRLVIVVNDNGRSYQPTIGGLANNLASLRVNQRYENVLDYIKTTLTRTPVVGAPLYGTLHGMKKGLKDVLQPQVLFEDLGLKYLGPIDGHDEQAVEAALRRARDFGHPVLVHVITRKGFGYQLAEDNEEDCLHQVPAAAPAGAVPGVPKRTWSEVFGEALVGDRRPAARRGGDHRRHAAPDAAGAVRPGLPGPGVRRGHRRAARGDQRGRPGHGRAAPGGGDLRHVPQPGVRPGADGRGAAPAAGHLRAGPGRRHRPGRGQPQRHVGRLDPAGRPGAADRRAAGRHPDRRAAERGGRGQRRADRGALPQGQRGCRGGAGRQGGQHGHTPPAGRRAPPDVLLAGAGPMAVSGLIAADRLADQGIAVTVVDPRWTKPLDPALADLARRARLVVTVEDNGLAGGFGDAVARLLRDAGVAVPVKTFGIPQRFLAHGTRDEVLDEIGLAPQHLARQITEAVARLDQEQEPASHAPGPAAAAPPASPQATGEQPPGTHRQA